VEYFLQFSLDRAVVGVCGHNILHKSPPSAADGSLSNGIPAALVFKLHISKQLTGLFVQKNRIRMHPVIFQRFFELRPDGIVAFLILAAAIRIYLHNKSFANHTRSFRTAPPQRKAPKTSKSIRLKSWETFLRGCVRRLIQQSLHKRVLPVKNRPPPAFGAQRGENCPDPAASLFSLRFPYCP